MEKKECEFGPVGSGTYQMRDAWGGFFTMDVQKSLCFQRLLLVK